MSAKCNDQGIPSVGNTLVFCESFPHAGFPPGVWHRRAASRPWHRANAYSRVARCDPLFVHDNYSDSRARCSIRAPGHELCRTLDRPDHRIHKCVALRCSKARRQTRQSGRDDGRGAAASSRSGSSRASLRPTLDRARRANSPDRQRIVTRRARVGWPGLERNTPRRQPRSPVRFPD